MMFKLMFCQWFFSVDDSINYNDTTWHFSLWLDDFYDYDV